MSFSIKHLGIKKVELHLIRYSILSLDIPIPEEEKTGGAEPPPQSTIFFQMLYINTSAVHHMYCWCPRSIIWKISS